ncbi:hypothetical protein B4091_3073 [Bacillus licheniformis]|nr:hypothetical protein B4091_3073 [Bacillus licheniformis]
MNSLPFVLKMKKRSLPLRNQNNEKSVFLQKRKKMVCSHHEKDKAQNNYAPVFLTGRTLR